MSEQVENIERVEIGEALGERFGEYSKYIIQARAIPDIRDGLKPVQRRTLFSMFTEGNHHDKDFRKSARAVGDIMGKYHPHGDSSTYGAMARMGQEWVMSIPLVEVDGNNGSIDGDMPAAMRYTNSRLRKIVVEAMMVGIKKKGVIAMVKNYDDTLDEPTVLPVQFPNLLVQGTMGISSGYATNIAPHSLKELMEGCIALQKNPETTLEELIQLIPAPDLPTGAVIVGAKSMVDVYSTGRGRVLVRAKYRVEEKPKLTTIIIEEIPYDVKKTDIITALDAIVDEKKVAGLVDARDESGREGLRIEIDISRDADVNTILGYVFKNTPLQKAINLNMVVIKDKKPVTVGLREILIEFNKFRRETRRRELEYDLKRLQERIHVVEGFIKLSDIINEVVNEIKESSGKTDARIQIMGKFEFSVIQAEAIVSMQLHRISRTDKKAYETEEKKLLRMIKAIELLLGSEKRFTTSIIKGYEKIIEEYGQDRRTEVIQEDENWEVRKVDTIVEEDTIVGVSSGGYLKRSTNRSFMSTTSPGLVEGDTQLFEGKATTRDFLMVFTNKMNYMYVPVHELDEVRWGANGKHIATYVELSEGETIVNAFTVSEADRDKYVLVAKSNGQVKRTLVSLHEIERRFWNLYVGIRQRTDEELVGAWLVEDTGSIGFADGNNRKMYFNISEIAPKGLRTEGMRGIHLDEAKGEKIKAHRYSKTEKGMPKSFKYRPRGQKGWA